MPIELSHNPFPVVPVEILKISGDTIYFVSQKDEILALNLNDVSFHEKRLKLYALSNVQKIKIDAGGFVIPFPSNDIDIFIPSDVIATYAKPLPSSRLSSILIKLYKDKRITKRFLAGNL